MLFTLNIFKLCTEWSIGEGCHCVKTWHYQATQKKSFKSKLKIPLFQKMTMVMFVTPEIRSYCFTLLMTFDVLACNININVLLGPVLIS